MSRANLYDPLKYYKISCAGVFLLGVAELIVGVSGIFDNSLGYVLIGIICLLSSGLIYKTKTLIGLVAALVCWAVGIYFSLPFAAVLYAGQHSGLGIVHSLGNMVFLWSILVGFKAIQSMPDEPFSSLVGTDERSTEIAELALQPEASSASVTSQLRQLESLRVEGLISSEEFEQKRADILARL